MPNLVENITTVDNLKTGGLVLSFYYQYFKHDPYPVVLTTMSQLSQGKVFGLNLHYLTFPIYRALLNQWAGNIAFNYYIIKQQPIIRQSFRSYKIEAIKNIKRINWQAIIQALSIIRNYSPQEMLDIQNMVDAQVASKQPEIINEIFGKFALGSLMQNMAQQQVSQNTQQPQSEEQIPNFIARNNT